ncbi:interferon regulatory factor 4 [Chanos chanos]|uniref:Interferon regulatory factor 4 n=1 Tax=Chanos chanos TaxID=29144 RepID=A0A6J2V2P6_CHACN|nr:interferon regulatory factor 4-like [Chanos chanos]
MNSEGVHATLGTSGSGKLRLWLIEQVDSGKYPGLVWENEEKSIFRIPWKHAGKQDYKREEDAALFKAWALFKGKFREGIDRPDPPTWKTRLRCALNKSNDFEELVERSQLDISDPYKVYRIIPEGAKKGHKSQDITPTHTSPNGYSYHQSYTPQQSQGNNFFSPVERNWREFLPDQSPVSEFTCNQNPFTQRWDHGYQISGSFYSCNASDPQPSSFSLESSMRSAEAMALSDCRLQVAVFYGGMLMRETTVGNAEGCRLAPCEEGRVYGTPGGPELVALPYSESGTLERGVLLWMAQDGLYALRLCTRRVYWEGGHSPYVDKPSKLEREMPTKVLDTQLYLTELQGYALLARPPPRCQVTLYFEEEYMDPLRERKNLTVQVEPLFARQLLLFTQQSSASYIRSHDHPPLSSDHMILPNQDYHRVIPHHHSNAMQD